MRATGLTRRAANLNIHLHCLVLDGVYRRTDGEPNFVEVPAPTDEALQALLDQIISRLMKLLTGRGELIEEQGSTYLADSDADSDDARMLRPLQAAACTYRIAFGPRAGLQGVHGARSHAARAAGQVVLKLKTPWRDGTTHTVRSPLKFIQRLATRILRQHLHRSTGVA